MASTTAGETPPPTTSDSGSGSTYSSDSRPTVQIQDAPVAVEANIAPLEQGGSAAESCRERAGILQLAEVVVEVVDAEALELATDVLAHCREEAAALATRVSGPASSRDSTSSDQGGQRQQEANLPLAREGESQRDAAQAPMVGDIRERQRLQEEMCEQLRVPCGERRPGPEPKLS